MVNNLAKQINSKVEINLDTNFVKYYHIRFKGAAFEKEEVAVIKEGSSMKGVDFNCFQEKDTNTICSQVKLVMETTLNKEVRMEIYLIHYQLRAMDL